MIFVNVKFAISISMRKLSVLIILLSLFAPGCEKKDIDIPGCIEEKIDSFKENVICDSGSYVAIYTFQGSNAFVFAEGNCGADLGAAVYSEDCNFMGFLGGISGNTLISGVRFYDSAKLVKKIWSN